MSKFLPILNLKDLKIPVMLSNEGDFKLAYVSLVDFLRTESLDSNYLLLWNSDSYPVENFKSFLAQYGWIESPFRVNNPLSYEYCVFLREGHFNQEPISVNWEKIRTVNYLIEHEERQKEK